MGTESTQALSRTEHPVGATRPAERLAERTGLDVAGADVDLQHAFTGDRTSS
jgi:hypothetical protein